MPDEHEVLRFQKRDGYVPRQSQGQLTLRPRAGFVPGAHRSTPASVETLSMTRRNNHTIMFRRLHPDSMVREIEFPVSCQMCFHQGDITEKLAENKWWWSCPECGHRWDPIEALDG